jgi:hypothetical protein
MTSYQPKQAGPAVSFGGNDTVQNCLRLIERIAGRFIEAGEKKPSPVGLDHKIKQKWIAEGLIKVSPGVSSVSSEKSKVRYFYKRQSCGFDTKPLNPDVTKALNEVLAHVGPRPFGFFKTVAKKHNVRYSSLVARYYAHFERLRLPVPPKQKKEATP